MDGLISRALGSAALLALAACATPRITAAPSELEARVPFLRPGETRLEEVIDRFGEPAVRHEAELTMIWNAGDDRDGHLRVVDPRQRRSVRVGSQETSAPDATWAVRLFEIVLQFDAAGTYVRGSVVRAE